MSSHLWQVKRPHPYTIADMKHWFETAVFCGFNETEAARYAAQRAERARQSSKFETKLLPSSMELPEDYTGRNTPNRYEYRTNFKKLAKLLPKLDLKTHKPDWRYGLGVHASEYTYNRLVGTPLPDDDGLANIPKVLNNLAEHRPGRHALVSKAIAAIDRVAPAYRFKTYVCNNGNTATKALTEWSTITRGKDLFIPGLGGFDINAAVAYLDQHPDIGVFNPQDFTALGYSIKWGRPNLRIYHDLLIPDLYTFAVNDVRRQTEAQNHALRRAIFIQHHQVLVAHEHLDVLLHAPHAMLVHYQDNPLGLITAAMQQRDLEEDEYLNGEVQHEPETFDHLLDWQPQTFDHEGEVYTVEPVRTSDDLKASAKRLKNCAYSYRYSVSSGELAILLVKRGDKLVGMAELDQGDARYEQLCGPCNERISDPLLVKRIQATAPAFRDQWVRGPGMSSAFAP